ncbi:MAG: peptidoglycan-binding protein [Ruminococcaceae bacterium]|nr:peptidoglycan-binding protein [Oscillospiraceae bacterium]
MPNQFERDAVTNLQRYLRQLSYFDRDISQVPIDGIFESATRKALRAYQRSVGLPETGVADRETWERLYLDYISSLSDNSPPAPVYVFPRYPNGYAIRRGDEGFPVYVAQFLLREMLIIYGEEQTAPEPDGKFGAATEAATRRFQQLHGLPPTGEIDKLTWNNLAAAHRPTVERFPVQ